jgi:flagella basal body P-ring formation protein FlgA
VAELARAFVLERFGADLAGATIEPVGTPRDLVLPAGEISTTVSLQAGSPGGGHLIVLVEAAVALPRGLRVERSATVTFRVSAPRPVVVAVRELARGAVIQPRDLRVEQRPAERTPRGALAEMDLAAGKEVVRALAPGEVVTSSAVAAVRAVRREAVVARVIQGPGFRIVARGVAAEDGAVGETIRVVNQSSRREVSGRIDDDRTVRVSF